MLTQKIPFNRSLPRAMSNRFSNLQQLLQKGLPATIVKLEKNGTIATVKFELDSQFNLPQVKMPVYGPEYVRWPLQEGCKGYVVPSDVNIGAMNGLGEGVATLTPQFNLSSGVFFPMGNTEFDDTDDPKKVVLYGPDGVIIRNGTKDSVLDIDSEHFTFSLNGNTFITVNKDGVTIDFAPTSADPHTGTSAVTGSTTATIYLSATGMLLSSFNRSISFTQSGLTIAGDGRSISFNSSGLTMNGDGHAIAINPTGITMSRSDGQYIQIQSGGTYIQGLGGATFNLQNQSVNMANGTGIGLNLNTSGLSASTPWGSSISLLNNQATIGFGGGAYVQCLSNQINAISAGIAQMSAPNGQNIYMDPSHVTIGSGNTTIDSRLFLQHTHYGVQTGGSNTNVVN